MAKARHTRHVPGRSTSVLISSAVSCLLLALVAGVGCSGQVDTQCAHASDCTSGASCIEGQCVVLPQCSRSGDCDAGSSCINNACVPVGNTCNASRDCSPGAICT